MKFDYNAYKARQETAKEAKTESKEWPALQFATTLLKKDGDFIVVRFPYHTPEDFHIEHCHEVALPGNQYPQKVECTKETGECILCDSKVKEVDRFLVKAVAYIIKDGQVELFPVVWDRPVGYATELEGKMNDYGDLTECLFKIKRNGTGTGTTYSTDIVTNKTVYNPEVYKADFSCLEHLEVDKILVRRMSKYLELVKPTTETKVVASASEPKELDLPDDPTMDEVLGTKTAEDPTTNRPKRHYQ
jgi:hypothetical protein